MENEKLAALLRNMQAEEGIRTGADPVPDSEEYFENDEAGESPEYRDSTYMIVSMAAYLLGVPERIFDNIHQPPQREWYDRLALNKNARIIRNLCVLRTQIEQRFGKIRSLMVNDLKNLHTLPEYISQESLNTLETDGIHLVRANALPEQYVIEINRLIKERIANCRSIFPIWISWDYLRDLFIMPDGLSVNGIRAAAAEYYANMQAYPYQIYLNWPGVRAGNILYNDKKFVSLLYEAHEDYFTDMSRITDAGLLTKNGIYSFLDDADCVDMVVDCENSDPFKLYAVLNNLDSEALLSKIHKIVLYDDVHTTSAWDILSEFTEIPVEHVEIERVKENKSLVDIRLTVGTMKAYYEEGVSAFILCSSDSDYWGMISAMPNMRFLVMVESEKCGPDIKQAMQQQGITYCYIDDFCTGNSDDIKVRAMLSEVRRRLDEGLRLNVNTILDEAFTATRATMSAAEQRQFYDRYLKPMKLVIAPNGDLGIVLGE